ncbi:hypothetical protein ANACOL_03170 [Anaerotruncus colihominis DSM 17241]|uniref:Uncharacterized protein n=1 Tax=Anaerotruncus colihominis DSM 17241 TaxID=445972 RepID=B0PDL6_9FIRM|nr:hypothetical protein ANACOL_03170 [Anaerotruncus colihominis DSM 17241]
MPEETFSEQDRVNILMDFVKQGYYQQAGAFVKQFSEPFYQIIVSQPFLLCCSYYCFGCNDGQQNINLLSLAAVLYRFYKMWDEIYCIYIRNTI